MENNRNTRNNRPITFENTIYKSLIVFCENFRLEYDVTRRRLNRGWSPAECIVGHRLKHP